MRFRVEDEKNDMPCGFDYESFVFGFYCEKRATKVIIEGKDFHYAHLCEEHTSKVLSILKRRYDYT